MGYKVGSVVQVLPWNELSKHRKIMPSGGVKVDGVYFNPKMKVHCGHSYTIDEIWNQGQFFHLCKIKNNGESGRRLRRDGIPWSFTSGMVQQVKKREISKKKMKRLKSHFNFNLETKFKKGLL